MSITITLCLQDKFGLVVYGSDLNPKRRLKVKLDPFSVDCVDKSPPPCGRYVCDCVVLMNTFLNSYNSLLQMKMKFRCLESLVTLTHMIR